MELKSRIDAINAGLKKFFTGRPCRRGHLAERYTSNSACVECELINSKAYSQTDKSIELRKTDKYKLHNANFNREYCKTDKKKSYTQNWKRLKLYGLSTEQFEALLAEQLHACCICRQPLRGIGTAANAPCVDHCHQPGKVRGILCMNCNKMLGLAKDSITTLQKAISYLSSN